MTHAKCMYCEYWEMWGNECVHPKSKRLFKYTPGMTKACEMFEPDIEVKKGKEGGWHRWLHKGNVKA